MYAITSLLLVVAISLLITRVATVILVATGMSGQSARFQARSAFSGAGFTTSESEAITEHPVRRRVVMTLMLLGNAGIVASASTLILGFRGGAVGAAGLRILELVIGIMALVYLSRSAWVDRRLTALISRLLRRYTDLPTRDLAGLLDLAGDYAVSELAVDEGDWIAERPLAQLAIREEGLAILGITRAGGRFLGTPTGATVVHVGDVLLVYGRGGAVQELDHRPAGTDGDAAHADAVARHHDLVAEQDRQQPGAA